MEDRTLLTTTVFLDFGDGFINDQLEMTVGQLGEGIRGPDFHEEEGWSQDRMLTLRSLESIFPITTWDYNKDSAVNRQDYLAVRDDVVSLVQRMYRPFNVDVEVASASNLEDVHDALRRNNGLHVGKHDAYVFVTGMETVIGGSVVSVGAEASLYGLASDDDLNGFTVSPWYDRNDLDEGAAVFADVVLGDKGATTDTVVGLANIAAHEAAHTFGLIHTMDGWTSDILMVGGGTHHDDWFHNRALFSRYPVPMDEPIPLIMDTHNSWEWLKEDDDIGLRPGEPEFVTGNEGIIKIEPHGSNALVRVGHHCTFSTFCPDYEYEISLQNGVWIEAGRGDDQVFIDASISGSFHVVGGQGISTLRVTGDGSSTLTYRPDLGTHTTLDGMDVMSGTVSAGAATITFDEFLPGSTVQVDGFATATLITPEGRDSLHVDAAWAGDTTREYVHFGWFDVGQVIADVSSRDTAAYYDVILVEGVWPSWQPGQESAGPLTIRSGEGNDRMAIAPDIEFLAPDSTGLVNWEAGSGSDTVVISEYSNYTLSQSLLTFAADAFAYGSLGLSGVDKVVASGTDASDRLSLDGSWGGQAIFKGRDGTDSLNYSSVANADMRIVSTTGNEWGLPPIVDQVTVGTGSVQVVNVETALLNDFNSWPHEVTIDNIASGSQGFQSINVDLQLGQTAINVLSTAADLDLTTHLGADSITIESVDSSVNMRIRTGDEADSIVLNDVGINTEVLAGDGTGRRYRHSGYPRRCRGPQQLRHD